MVRVKDENETNANHNYCLMQWKNFTTLTEQEQRNLREIIAAKTQNEKNGINEIYPKKRNRIYKGKKCFCRETKTIYSTQTECAHALNVTIYAINKAIKRNTAVKGKYHIAEL